VGPRGRRVAAVATVLAALALAGCGGSGGGGQLSKAQYEQKLRVEGSRLQAATSGFSLQVNNLKALSRKLETLRGKIETAASDFDSFRPPADAVADNKKIADVLHKLADLFGQMKTAADHHDLKQLQQDVVQLRTLGTEGTTGTDDLKAKGYKVGKFG
jgi:hypothetical protein